MRNLKKYIFILLSILFLFAIFFSIYFYQNKKDVFVRKDGYKNSVAGVSLGYGACKVLDLHYKQKPQEYTDTFSTFPNPQNKNLKNILGSETRFIQYPLTYFSKDIFADDWTCNQEWRESTYNKNSPGKDWKYSPESLKESVKYNNYLGEKQNSEKIIQFFITLAKGNPQILKYGDEDYLPRKFTKIITSKKYGSGLLVLVEKEEIADTSYRNAYITIDKDNLNMYLSPSILYFGVNDSALLPPKSKNGALTVSTEDCKKYFKNSEKLKKESSNYNKNILNIVDESQQISFCKEIYKNRDKNRLLADEYIKNLFPIYKKFKLLENR